MATSKCGGDGDEKEVELEVNGSDGPRPLRKPFVTEIAAPLVSGGMPKGHPVKLWLTRGETLKLIKDLASHLQTIDGTTVE